MPKKMTGGNGGQSGLERSPIHLLHRVGQCAEDIFASRMTDVDLTPRQLAVLIAVSENEGLSQTNLAARTRIDRSTLADVVLRLKAKGLLERRRTREDACAYAVKLSEEGRHVLRTVLPLAERVEDQVLAALPDENRANFLHKLQSIVDALQSR